MGGSTAGTIAANAVATGLLDRYLAKTGYKSQQTNELRDSSKPANLWEPVDGSDGQDHGTHGAFDAVAHPRSTQRGHLATMLRSSRPL